jgi:hypothetical protein
MNCWNFGALLVAVVGVGAQDTLALFAPCALVE